LAAAAGESSKEIAARLGCSRSTVGRWRGRFAERGLDGLHDEPRPGKPRSIGDEDVERVIVKTLEEQPPNATHLPRPAVHRQGPRHRQPLPQPPGRRRRALRRREVPDPGARSLGAGAAANARRPRARHTHDYVRNGTTNLYAALDVASGQVIADMSPRHRAEEFRRFLNLIERSVAAHLDVHVVLDNSSTHKTPSIQRWLLRHPRITLHFTPTYSSWLNLVERWFAELTTKSIKRSAHRSVRDLVASIRTWITTGTKTPSPTSGTKPQTRSSTASLPTASGSLTESTHRAEANVRSQASTRRAAGATP
jgi:transposase